MADIGKVACRWEKCKCSGLLCPYTNKGCDFDRFTPDIKTAAESDGREILAENLREEDI